MKQLILSPEQRQGDSIRVDGKDFHYLVHVRRLLKGDRISALLNDFQLSLEVEEVSADCLQLGILSEAPRAQMPTQVTLFAFLLKARKLDDVIRQACETGVSAFVPVQGDHCISQLETPADQAKKLDRWKAIAKEAAQQSGSPSVCEVHPVLSSRNIPSWWQERGPLLFFHQRPLAKTSLHRYLFLKPTDVGLIIGPEGGLSAEETTFFEKNKALPIWLGPTVLRAETASLYATAAVQIILQEKTEWTIPL